MIFDCLFLLEILHHDRKNFSQKYVKNVWHRTDTVLGAKIVLVLLFIVFLKTSSIKIQSSCKHQKKNELFKEKFLGAERTQQNEVIAEYLINIKAFSEFEKLLFVILEMDHFIESIFKV